MKLASEDQYFFFGNYIEEGGKKRDLTVQEKQKKIFFLGAFDRDWLLFSDSLLLAHTGDMDFCYLSCLNIQVAVDNADLSGKTKMQKNQLSTSRFQSDISL